VVVLIERGASDEHVMREARARISAYGAPLVLVHVARLEQDVRPWSLRWQRGVDTWQQMRGIERTVSDDLRILARQWVGPATRVDVVVRFGDPVAELAAVAEERGARLVVARSRRSRWRLGGGRDGRLRRALNGPLVLVRRVRVSQWVQGSYPPSARRR
jgi:nucleotide-binding universal stress UspA family protein